MAIIVARPGHSEAAAPVAGPVTASVPANSSGNAIALAITGGATSVAVVSAAAHGTATASGTTILYTPAAGYSGADSFTYSATNGGGASAPATVTISVVAPSIAIDISQTMIGMSGGVDMRLSDAIIAGIGFGYGRSSADIGSNGTESVGQAFSAALYGSYNTGRNIFIDALLGYSYLDFDSDRYVTDTGAFASGSRDGSQIFGSITASYEYSTGPLLLSPYGRLQTAWSQLNGFEETGGGYYNLIYGDQSITTVAGVIGLRSEYTIPTSWSVLIAGGRLEYTHSFTDSGTATMGYADLGGDPPYSLAIDPLDNNYATIGAGLDARMPNGMMFGVSYQGMIGFDGEDVSQTITLRASTRF